MKKKVKKTGFDFERGLKYLRFSFLLLLALVIMLLFIFILMGLSIIQLRMTILRMPDLNDYAILFAGAILFIVVPFILGGKFKKLCQGIKES